MEDINYLHPYQSGMQLCVSFKPENSHSIFNLSLTIIKAFEPFSMGQTLLVQQPEIDSPGRPLALPKKLILKLLDRRYSGRVPGLDSWTPGNEPRIRQGVRELIQGRWPNPFRRLGGTHQEFDGDSELWKDWMVDIRVWESLQKAYEKELAAYRKLRSLQGIHIPRMFGTVRYDIPHGLEHIHPIVDSVDGLMVEYVDGINMEDLHVGTNISKDDAHLASQNILQIMRELRRLEVLHNDVRAANVLIRRDDPTRPVLIDFGLAWVRRPDESEKEWKRREASFHEIDEMRWALASAGLHIPSPIASEELFLQKMWGYQVLNRDIEKMDPEWREKLYERVTYEGPDYEMRTDEDGKVWKYEYPNWKLKPGVKTSKGPDDSSLTSLATSSQTGMVAFISPKNTSTRNA